MLTISLVALALAVGRHNTVQEDVFIPTRDGGMVQATVYGAGDHAVVLAHGGRFTKESWSRQVPVLVDAGFRVLAINFRGRGQSRGGSSTAGRDDGVHFDVLAGVNYLRETGARTVSVVGASFGGWAAAQAAVETPTGTIDRLVLLASAPIDHPERMQGRKLFITSRGDTTGSGALRLPTIRDQYERAWGTKELVVVDGAAHAQFIFATDQSDRLMREIVRFLSAP